MKKKLNILVIGSGAREHSICWSLSKSEKTNKLFCIPGNAGISKIASCEEINPADKKSILKFCKEKKIELAVIGPEEYLATGLSDFLIKNKVKTFGPSKKASRLESSKSFAKKFLNRHKISTPSYKEFTSAVDAKKFLKNSSFPLVIKADGLAAGKGVVICQKLSEGLLALEEILSKKKFGNAGKKIIIEEFIEGFEISFFAFFDKKSFLPFGYALDHKKAYENDVGPNTGGMGCFTPSKLMNKNLEEQIYKDIIKKTFYGLRKDKVDYRGVIFFGLMIKNNKPYIIEYNVRFGDPECQTLLRDLKTDLLDIFLATIEDELSKIKISKYNMKVICVVLASLGYPGNYQKNKLLKNLDKVKKSNNIEVFHAGTKLVKNKFYSNGGRVLCITARSTTLENARRIVYKTIKAINWKNGFYRKDIGIKNK